MGGVDATHTPTLPIITGQSHCCQLEQELFTARLQGRRGGGPPSLRLESRAARSLHLPKAARQRRRGRSRPTTKRQPPPQRRPKTRRCRQRRNLKPRQSRPGRTRILARHRSGPGRPTAGSSAPAPPPPPPPPHHYQHVVVNTAPSTLQTQLVKSPTGQKKRKEPAPRPSHADLNRLAAFRAPARPGPT